MSESRADQVTRLQLMAGGDPKYDLSPNDRAAIGMALDALKDACPHCGRRSDEAKKTEAERALDHFLSGAPMRDFEG